MKPSDLKAQALVFKALAHPGRLLVVSELAHGERCVCELTKLLGSKMPTVSRHLSLLKHAKIVEDEKRGTQVYYRLAMPCVVHFFECVSNAQQQQT